MLREKALLRVSKADKKTLGFYAEGVYISTQTGRPFHDLQQQVCADRLRLAKEFLATADKMVNARPPHFRSAVSRYYYSMYHAARALVYFAYGGDDYEAHSTLPTKLPDDFTNTALWQNALKDARGHRNEADYDPYPSEPRSWRPTAIDLGAKAPDLLSLVVQYLKQKGCAYV